MDHVYSCKYGTFLFNSEKLRYEQEVRHKTISIWTYMNHNKVSFLSRLPSIPFTNCIFLKKIELLCQSLVYTVKRDIDKSLY